jgi:hypothetical protein
MERSIARTAIKELKKKEWWLLFTRILVLLNAYLVTFFSKLKIKVTSVYNGNFILLIFIKYLSPEYNVMSARYIGCGDCYEFLQENFVNYHR